MNIKNLEATEADGLKLVQPVTREIRGDTTYFADLFMRMSGRYPECRIVAEPGGGVSIRFEGSWKDRLRVPKS